ncbi:MAG TPA: hypothetical protein VF290_09515 [Pyrinomonadaceae bacterium]
MKVILFLVVFVTSASAQKVSDVEKEYGAPTQVYSVSEHIWMTPEYGIDGQICRARLYPKRIAPKANYLWKELPFHELTEVLRRLIPPAQRGAAKEFFGETQLGGGMGWTTYPYENVSIVFLFAGRVDPESVRRIESPTFPLEDAPVQRDQKPPPSYREIPFNAGIEIAAINWTKRKCTD